MAVNSFSASQAINRQSVTSVSRPLPRSRGLMHDKDEYGDWQTSIELALSVCRMLKKQGVNPKVVIEPTCGKGNFILAALQVFGDIEDVYGIEIYNPYLDDLKLKLREQSCIQKARVHLYNCDIFNFDFSEIKQAVAGREVLVLGNPPWVTNSKLGLISSGNLPKKSNFKKTKGIAAITGKGNFDIAEYICNLVVGVVSGETGTVALLLKNSVIKNIVYEQRSGRYAVNSILQYAIDAKKEFGVSVSAALMCMTLGDLATTTCQVKDFYTLQPVKNYGWVGKNFVSDIALYHEYGGIDGHSPVEWWSGVKHDCSKVMELTRENGKLINGFGDEVDVEEEMVYPLLKSSDVTGGEISETRKYVVISQKSINEDTSLLEYKMPKAYKYLNTYANLLDNRGSSIYKNKPRFCLFGIGQYSFKKYKVAVSGLYKHIRFSLVHSICDRPVMLDDTCYMLGFDGYKEAFITYRLLNSAPVQAFIGSLLFADAKRVVNKDLLMRVDLLKAASIVSSKDLGVSVNDMEMYVSYLRTKFPPKQALLF